MNRAKLESILNYNGTIKEYREAALSGYPCVCGATHAEHDELHRAAICRLYEPMDNLDYVEFMKFRREYYARAK